MIKPILSVVIANYNYGRYLESAIISVIRQKGFEKVELIIVDGGSTDESVEIIRKYEHYVAWWCSERDSGQSEAFNKGFAHATGMYLTWLNSDDIFIRGAFEKLFEAIDRYAKCDWFVGGSCYMTEEMRVFRCVPDRPISKVRASMSEIHVFGPSSFFSRKLFDSVGGHVDESLHYLMDIELWNRFYHVGGVCYKRIGDYIWGFRFQPTSKTTGFRCGGNSESIVQMHKERDMVKAKYSTRQDSVALHYFSMPVCSVAKGWVDTLRLRGRLATEF